MTIQFQPELARHVKLKGDKLKFPFILAKDYGDFKDENLVGWWVSEKLDGVRALWTGTDFLSRGGVVYDAPEWFKKAMPQGVVLDGELFLGRGKFNECSGICRRGTKGPANDADWRRLTFVTFDAPLHTGDYEYRQDFIRALLLVQGTQYIVHHKQSKIESQDQIPALLKLVEDLGGEGLIVRRPKNRYELGKRSKNMLKVVSRYRAEGTVIGHQPGEGKHVGRLGALLVRLENGVEVGVGTGFTDAERETPPALGSIVTFEYREKDAVSGVPRFPAYVTVRDYE